MHNALLIKKHRSAYEKSCVFDLSYFFTLPYRFARWSSASIFIVFCIFCFFDFQKRNLSSELFDQGNFSHTHPHTHHHHHQWCQRFTLAGSLFCKNLHVKLFSCPWTNPEILSYPWKVVFSLTPFPLPTLVTVYGFLSYTLLSVLWK